MFLFRVWPYFAEFDILYIYIYIYIYNNIYIYIYILYIYIWYRLVKVVYNLKMSGENQFACSVCGKTENDLLISWHCSVAGCFSARWNIQYWNAIRRAVADSIINFIILLIGWFWYVVVHLPYSCVPKLWYCYICYFIALYSCLPIQGDYIWRFVCGLCGFIMISPLVTSLDSSILRN